MASSYRLFKIFGISVELHWTFVLFLLFLLITDTAYFYVLLLVFLIVLIHELCHSFAALSYGIKVPSITLTPIGGISSIEVPEDPKKEFVISLAGPGSNFVMMFIVLGIAFYIGVPLSVFVNTQGLTSIDLTNQVSILTNLFWINFILGIFNILPGFPMDGGRVFRALIAFKKDYIEATQIAVNVGRVIAALIIILGFLTTSVFTIVIGIFLFYAGGQELEVLKLRHYLKGLTAGKIAAPSPKYVTDSMSLREFMENVASSDQAHYPVIDAEHKIIGVLNLSDLRNVPESDFPVAMIRNIMRRNVSVVESNMDVEKNLAMLLSNEYFFVEDQGRIIGYITPSQVVEAARFYGITKKK